MKQEDGRPVRRPRFDDPEANAIGLDEAARVKIGLGFHIHRMPR
jgi:hypothetical protein